jgi:hypothetical protein
MNKTWIIVASIIAIVTLSIPLAWVLIQEAPSENGSTVIPFEQDNSTNPEPEQQPEVTSDPDPLPEPESETELIPEPDPEPEHTEPELTETEPIDPEPKNFLESWLFNNTKVCQAIAWENQNGSTSYIEWTGNQKNDLFESYVAISRGDSLNWTDPVSNIYELEDNDSSVTGVYEPVAWKIYLAHVANTLFLEIENKVNWSITEYSDEALQVLMDSRYFFTYIPTGYLNVATPHYQFPRAIPAPLDIIQNFFEENDIIQGDKLHTIGQLLEWCRENMRHFTGSYIAENCEYHWNYRGSVPVSRVINGIEPTPEGTLALHYTAGCHGTNWFLCAVLRVVNIPVKYVVAGGHATPYFVSEGLYLSHGDDLYSGYAKVTPMYSALELLINQTTYDSWFGEDVPYYEVENNVGRQVSCELLIKFLPDFLVEKHLEDLLFHNSHSNSEVYRQFERWYSVEELENMGLWVRLDKKIENLITPISTQIRNNFDCHFQTC